MKSLQILAGILLMSGIGVIAGCAHHSPAELNGQLLQAIRNGDATSVQRLLKQGASVEAKDEGGETALAIAVDYGNSQMVKLLLDKGADPKAGGLNDDAALINSAMVGNASKTKLLLERGASAATKNEALLVVGASEPLTITLSPEEMAREQERLKNFSQTAIKNPTLDYGEAARLLIEHGADIETRDEQGSTPLIRAAEHGGTDVVKALLEKGAAVDARDKGGSTALIAAACSCAAIDMPETLDSMKLLLEKGAEVNAQSKDGTTALMAAVSAGRTDNAQLLLDKKADLEARDQNGNTALLVAASAGPYSSAGVVDAASVVKLLLDRGADVKVRNKRGETVLGLATKARNKGVVILLRKAMKK